MKLKPIKASIGYGRYLLNRPTVRALANLTSPVGLLVMGFAVITALPASVVGWLRLRSRERAYQAEVERLGDRLPEVYEAMNWAMNRPPYIMELAKSKNDPLGYFQTVVTEGWVLHDIQHYPHPQITTRLGRIMWANRPAEYRKKKPVPGKLIAPDKGGKK